jgi:hypothetical protein
MILPSSAHDGQRRLTTGGFVSRGQATTLVRMVLVPSVMELIGDRNWWMPSWLDRVVPHLGIEVDVDRALPHAEAGTVPDVVEV